MSHTVPLRIPLIIAIAASAECSLSAQDSPFGSEFPQLDSEATGEWWKKSSEDAAKSAAKKMPAKKQAQARNAVSTVDMNLPRDQVVAFALYTHDHDSRRPRCGTREPVGRKRQEIDDDRGT